MICDKYEVSNNAILENTAEDEISAKLPVIEHKIGKNSTVDFESLIFGIAF